MSGRLIYLFRRFVNKIKTPFVKIPARKSLVPDRDRFSGPKAVAVHYQVEDISTSKVHSVRHQLPNPYSFFTLLKTTMTSDVMGEEASGAAISPPAAVRGMKTLDRSLFSRTVSVPALKVPSRHIRGLTKSLRVALLKMRRVKAVAELAASDPLHCSHKLFMLDPGKFTTAEDFSAEEQRKLAEFGVGVEEGLLHYDLQVGYENWGVPEVLRAVLPETSDGVSGYSIIGHIVHLNLKPDVLDYKRLIGEVILDKNSSVKTVVNKINTIDNTFRNFQMELLAGEDNFITRAKENGCVFEMDFAKVYWNPRLSTEHERAVSLLKAGAVLYDVFAGVGPFAIPAAKKGVSVLANDLNPHSHSALCANLKLNKVKVGTLQAHNMDGREFILTVVKPDLTARLQARARAQGGGFRVVGGEEADCATAPTPAPTPTPVAKAVPESDSGGTAHSAVPAMEMELSSCEEAMLNTLGSGSDCRSDNTQAGSDIRSDNTRAESDSRSVNTRAESDSRSDISANPQTGSDNNSGKTPSSTDQQHQEQPHHHKGRRSSSISADLGAHELWVTMNLPAMALEFLDAFCDLLQDFPEHLRADPAVVEALPTVLCYCFEHKKEAAEGDVKSRAEKVMGRPLPGDAVVRSVRNVAPGKEMMCLQFRLTPSILFGGSTESRDTAALVPGGRQAAEEDQPPGKRQKMSADV